MSRPIAFFDAAMVDRLLDYPTLIERIRDSFLAPPVAPDRLMLTIPANAGAAESTLLVMPALRAGSLIIVKLVTIHPDLGHRPQGALAATMLVLSAIDGSMCGVVDGHAITRWRTAATSVLAARILARPDARRLLLVGAGVIAHALGEAYTTAGSITEVAIWARRPEAATALAARLCAAGIDATPVENLRLAAAKADIISTATLSSRPLLFGADVRPGTHVDLVGGFRPNMRETDDALICAARIVVDSPRALSEAGDLVDPIAAGVINATSITSLDVALSQPVERRANEITLFKSVGLAAEDLAAAELLFERLEK